MSEYRVIKKYPNRRLYDTVISSYITLEDVRRLIMEQVAIKVIDARSQEDITHSTLLQIIIEQEATGPSLFSTDSLQQLIRTYGGTMQHMLGKMFEQGVNLFNEQQQIFKKQTTDNAGAPAAKDPLQWMTEFTQKQMQQWQQLQQQWLKAFASQMQPMASAERYAAEPQASCVANEES
jgi:polyhydroxyalkanoate synthesis repressor PhaR